MAMILGQGQEMKMTIKSTNTSGSRAKTIRYLDPMAANTSDTAVTSLARDLMKNSQNSYVATSGSIELGILKES